MQPSAWFPAIQGHRGASGVAPENTLAAFRRAIDMGADALEMDLQLTKDGSVVILHDATLERTTDRPGRLADLTLAEVKQADAGAKAPAYRGERIPTLAEVIDLAKTAGTGRTRLNLELKYHVEGLPTPDLERATLAVLRQARFTSQVFIQSFHHGVLPRVQAVAPDIPRGVLVGKRQAPIPDPVTFVREHAGTYYAPEFVLVTPGVVAACHGAGIPVVTWTVNETREMERLLAMGIGALPGDGIISNYPDRLVALKQARR